MALQDGPPLDSLCLFVHVFGDVLLHHAACWKHHRADESTSAARYDHIGPEIMIGGQCLLLRLNFNPNSLPGPPLTQRRLLELQFQLESLKTHFQAILCCLALPITITLAASTFTI